MVSHNMCRLGVTASRKGLTEHQVDGFTHLVKVVNPFEFHDGDCIGGDEQAHAIVREQAPRCYMVGHPPENKKQRAGLVYNREHPAKGYVKRNQEIVDMSTKIIAMPDSKKEKQRSGTWATIRYARKIGADLSILYPDGTVGT